MKGKTIQDRLHLVRTIVEKVDGNATPINFDQSKVFDRFDYGFLEAVLSAAGFGLPFRTWIRLLYASPGVMAELNEVRFHFHFDSLDSAWLHAIADALHSCV